MPQRWKYSSFRALYRQNSSYRPCLPCEFQTWHVCVTRNHHCLIFLHDVYRFRSLKKRRMHSNECHCHCAVSSGNIVLKKSYIDCLGLHEPNDDSLFPSDNPFLKPLFVMLRSSLALKCIWSSDKKIIITALGWFRVRESEKETPRCLPTSSTVEVHHTLRMYWKIFAISVFACEGKYRGYYFVSQLPVKKSKKACGLYAVSEVGKIFKSRLYAFISLKLVEEDIFMYAECLYRCTYLHQNRNVSLSFSASAAARKHVSVQIWSSRTCWMQNLCIVQCFINIRIHIYWNRFDI